MKGYLLLFFQCLQELKQRDQILATLLHAAQMQFVQREIEQELADALLITLETLMLLAALSVQSTQTVHQTRHVQDYIVWIPVQDCVEPMLSAELSTTSQHAPAMKAMKEIRFLLVACAPFPLKQWLRKILVIQIHVDQTLFHQGCKETMVDLEVANASAPVCQE